MILSIIGGNRYVDSIIHDTLNKLFETEYRHLRNLDLDIEITISKKLDGDGYTYYQQGLDTTGDIHIIDIHLNKNCDIGTTLKHEIAHVEQYVTGRLKHIKDNLFEFNGKMYDTSKIEYKSLPWEIEAFEKENLHLI